MRTITKLLCVSILFLWSISAQGQKMSSAQRSQMMQFNNEIISKSFDGQLFADALFFYVNKELSKQGLRTLQYEPVLANAAQPCAAFCAKADDVNAEVLAKKQPLAQRLKLAGGALPGTAELVGKFPISKGKSNMYYDSVAISIVFKWFNSKSLADFTDETKVKCGIGAQLDVTGKKVYVSLILGNYSSINKNAAAVKANPGFVTSNGYKLKPYDSKICKPTDKMKNLNRFQNGLSADSLGNIFFQTDDFKQFTRLLKEPTSALAVDILSLSQFPCAGDNITDYSLPSRGYMLKPVPQPKILSQNLVKGKDAKNKCKIPLGKVSPGMVNYELSLIIVQEKTACASLYQSYKEAGRSQTQIKLEILADTITTFSSFTTNYQPKPDTVNLEFKIPFKAAKSDYAPEDIKPFIDALNQPDFNVFKLEIAAYSSIDGKEAANGKLREMRSKTIYDAFKKMNPGLDTATIYTSDSWSLFCTDVKGTEFEHISKMDKAQAVEYIKNNNLDEKLEPILSKHRFAQIKMRAIHDINGAKERDFVIHKFHEALAKNDLPQALSIEKYIMHKVVRKKYPAATVYKMIIPKDSVTFAGMEMNRLWLEYYIENKPIDTAFSRKIKAMAALNPDNDYIKFNLAYCRVMFDTVKSEAQIDGIQKDIDALLTSSLSKTTVSPLNLKFQLELLNSMNVSFEPTDEAVLTSQILDRIKAIVELDDSNWKQALSLANLFMEMNDYPFACTILEPYIKNNSANEDILFTYLSACSNVRGKHQTEIFSKAFNLAAKWNKKRLCELINSHKFSYIIFENPEVKGNYCTNCQE